MAEANNRGSRRKAAADSQRRWQSVFVDETETDEEENKEEIVQFTPDPDFRPNLNSNNKEAIGAYIRNKSKDARPKHATIAANAVGDENILKTILTKLACPKCSSNNLIPTFEKLVKESQKLCISCGDCKQELFKDDVPYPKTGQSPHKCRGSCLIPKRSKCIETDHNARHFDSKELLTDPKLYESSDDSLDEDDANPENYKEDVLLPTAHVTTEMTLKSDNSNAIPHINSNFNTSEAEESGSEHHQLFNSSELQYSSVEDSAKSEHLTDIASHSSMKVHSESKTEHHSYHVPLPTSEASRDNLSGGTLDPSQQNQMPPSNEECHSQATSGVIHDPDSQAFQDHSQNLGENFSQSYPKKKKKMRPLRPCVFCSKLVHRLSIHVKDEHGLHPFVQNMIRQVPEVENKMMRQLRCEGIYAENQRRISSGPGMLLRVSDPGPGEFLLCISCKGYFSRKFIWSHKLTCTVGRPQGGTFIRGSPSKRGRRGRPNKEEVAMRKKGRLAKEVLVTEVSPQSVCFDDGTLGTSGHPLDPSSVEASQLQQIVDGMHPNHFLQDRINSSCVKQETMDANLYQNGFLHPGLDGMGTSSNMRGKNELHRGQLSHQSIRRTSGGNSDDQMIFESIPAILANGTTDTNSKVPQAPPKKRSRDSWSGYEDDNYYFMPDFQGEEMQDVNVVPYNSYSQPVVKKRKSRSEFQYKFWTKEEEQRIFEYFTDFIHSEKIPGKDACRDFLKENPEIQTDWSRVKYKVYNEIQKRKKKARKLDEQTIDNYEEFLEPGHHILSEQSVSTGQVSTPSVRQRINPSGSVSRTVGEQCIGNVSLPVTINERCLSSGQAIQPIVSGQQHRQILPSPGEQCMSNCLPTTSVSEQCLTSGSLTQRTTSEQCLAPRQIHPVTSEQCIVNNQVHPSTSEHCMVNSQIRIPTSEHCMSGGPIHVPVSSEHCMSAGHSTITSGHAMMNENTSRHSDQTPYMDDQRLVINEQSLIPEQTMTTGHHQMVV